MTFTTTPLLAADVGGTKTNLAVYESVESLGAPLAAASLPSSRYPDLEALIQEFVAEAGITVDRACLGVAGPVAAGRSTITNLSWTIEESQLREALGLSSLCLINDLEAVATAVPHLTEGQLHPLQAGEATPGGPIAVIAPGTGLGQGYLTWDGERYRAHASEGGHASFAPSSPLERELLAFLDDRIDHVSVEWVASGVGIPNIYAFVKETQRAPEPGWLAARLAEVQDPVPVIVDTALNPEHSCEICTLTLDIFLSVLGAETGNMALKILATGGVYLGGGIPPRVLPALTDGPFLNAFLRKGRMSELLARMPLHVILEPRAALFGAARHGFRMMP